MRITKNMNKISMHHVVLLIIGFILIINASAQTVPSTSEDKMMYTGHEKKIEIAIKESTDIVVAAFTKLGFGGPDADAESFYEQAEIKIITALKGTLSGNIPVSYTIQWYPGNIKETIPVIGTQYIMFIQKLGPQENRIKKILPATDEKVSSVKALIVAQPAH